MNGNPPHWTRITHHVSRFTLYAFVLILGLLWLPSSAHADGPVDFTEICFQDATEPTTSVAWGDMDGDGDLDLAAGNYRGRVNRVHRNTRQGGQALPNNAPSIGGTAPYTSSAGFYAAPVVLDTPTIPIPYTLFDPEGDPVGQVEAFYSRDGGGRWLPAVSTTDTITTNLATGRQVDASRAYSPARAIPNGPASSLGVTLAVTEAYDVADLDVWLVISHTQNADLEAMLVSPSGITVSLFSSGTLADSNLIGTLFDDQASTPVILGTAPYTRVYRPVGSLAAFNGEAMSGTWTLVITDTQTNSFTGTLAAWGLGIETPPAAHVFKWDTFASDFFGQSDNVVFRMVAYPQPSTSVLTDTYHYPNSTPGPYQRPYASVTTFPFRVRGTQVRVMSETVVGTLSIPTPIPNALVYRLPEGQATGGFPLTYLGACLSTRRCRPSLNDAVESVAHNRLDAKSPMGTRRISVLGIVQEYEKVMRGT